MKLSGKNFIGRKESAIGKKSYSAVNPKTNQNLSDHFHNATTEEIDEAVSLSLSAFNNNKSKTGKQRAAFLRAIAGELSALGEEFIECAHAETGLPHTRLQGERNRTMNQLVMFANLIEEGSWVDARIDHGDPQRSPVPKPDTRSMLVPLGPVVVFGASNFPLAFSVAGGDTASAFAAGCTVIVKAHPSHPGTSEYVARSILIAADKTDMPDGIFSMIHGQDHATGKHLVTHPDVTAVGFTGSFNGGKALHDLAASRNKPIPVYAEMGSSNPVFILPEALHQFGDQLVQQVKNSVTLGAGQFCTNPGLIFTLARSEQENLSFSDQLKQSFSTADRQTMLNRSIKSNYLKNLETAKRMNGIEHSHSSEEEKSSNEITADLLRTDIENYLTNNSIQDEIFGPATILVASDSKQKIMDVADKLHGHLTVSIHGTSKDLEEFKDLIDIVQQKAGRVIINGFPTGVEVCSSMVHGGPFPATSDGRSTSVGTMAINRFTRPICFQDFPEFLLPNELKDGNPLGIRRMEDGAYT